MFHDILSMYSYRLSDSAHICIPLECQVLLEEMGWLQVTVVYIYSVLLVERYLCYSYLVSGYITLRAVTNKLAYCIGLSDQSQIPVGWYRIYIRVGFG